MKIAIFHYHLCTGGVTTVLKHQVLAMQGLADLVVFTGEAADTRLPCPVETIPELGYDDGAAASCTPETLAGKVLDRLHQHWPGGCDLLHIHNPTLAKNQGWLRALFHLQQAGVKLLPQIHDFAEDGRPSVHSSDPYPRDCHYIVLNSRDADILRQAGLKPEGVHLLPNIVAPFPPAENEKITAIPTKNRSATRRVLYPVRAIRRKNIGEALLIARFLPPGQRLAITLPPNSPVDTAAYNDWVHWANETNLPVEFSVGITENFHTLVNSCQSILTTSISEGFGFSFLEPWTAGKWLWGRRLDAICTDFEANGLHLDHLYRQMLVPLDWIDRQAYAHSRCIALDRAEKRFRKPLDRTSDIRFWERIEQTSSVDFGLLNERFQRQVFVKMLAAPFKARSILIRLNPWLAEPGRHPGFTDSLIAKHIADNRRAIERHYHPAAYGRRLLDIYRQVLDTPVRHAIDKEALIDAFANPDAFPLLAWGAYEN